MLLAANNQKIQAVSDAVATITSPVVTVDWEDLTTPGQTPGTSNTALSGTTPVDIVASPAANTYRTVKNITIYNGDTVTHRITVQYNDGGTVRILVSQSVTAGQTLEYTDGVGWALFSPTSKQVSTRQVLTPSSTPPYATPAGSIQLRVRMVGGGGGGGGYNSGTSGGAGGDTSFNSVVAKGGSGGGPGTSSIGSSGRGGRNGAGTAASFRASGQSGTSGSFSPGAFAASDGNPGGSSLLGGGSAAASAPADNNTGGGGAGAESANTGISGGGGGGGGEYVELIINSPLATYTFTVGAGGAGSTGASINGSAGGNGVIIVDEYY